jgi:hypothetical protein
MEVPEGRRNLNTHVDEALFSKVRGVAIRQRLNWPQVIDRALELWAAEQRAAGASHKSGK